MKKSSFVRDIVLSMSAAIYLYLLVKIILMKFGPVDLTFLLHQLKSNIGDPGRILRIFAVTGNVVPFQEITNGFRRAMRLDLHAAVNLFGNIALFIPLGLYIPLLFRRWGDSWAGVMLLSFGLSLCFELTQLFLSIGTFDVDDLILNTSGGMIGYGIYRIVVYIRANLNGHEHHSSLQSS